MADLIDKSKVIQRLCAECANMGSFICISCTIPNIIKQMQTIEAAPVRRGRWIEIEHYHAHGEEYCDCECSMCRHRISRVRGYYPNYCEECGSMNGGAENGKTD